MSSQSVSRVFAAKNILPGNPVGCILGDSYATFEYNGADFFNAPIGGTARASGIELRGAKGIMNWALALSGQRVSIPPRTHIRGYPSQTTRYVLNARKEFIAQMTPKPSFMVLFVGVNNILRTGDVASFKGITTDFRKLVLENVKDNIRTILVPIPPRANTVLNAAQYALVDKVNRWLRSFAQSSMGWAELADGHQSYIADGAAVGLQPLPDTLVDDTHLSVFGAYYTGKAIAAILSRWYAPIDHLPSNNITWDATNAPDANLLTNATMQGTGGTVTGPATGVAATGYTVTMGGGGTLAVAASVVTSAVSGRRMVQLDISGSYDTTGDTNDTYAKFARMFAQVATAARQGIKVGDKYEAFCAVEVDAGHTGFAFPALEWRWDGSAGNNNKCLSPGTTAESIKGVPPGEAMNLTLRTPVHEYTSLPGANLQLLAFAYLRNLPAGVINPSLRIRFGAFAIQKAEDGDDNTDFYIP